MRLKIVYALIILSPVFYTCQSSKKNTAANKENVVATDTTKKKENAPPKKALYQASNTLINDLVHTKLEVSFDWANRYVNGKATIKLKPHFYPTKMCYLNARGMDIKSVKLSELAFAYETKTVKGKKEEFAIEKTIPVNSTFIYENDSIKITLGREFTANEAYILEIEYTAKPDELEQGGSNAISGDKGLYFINPDNKNQHKMQQIWTQGETQSSSAWFPTIDSPNQKTTQEVYITVMEKFATLSNGVLVESKNNGNGTKTDYWKMDLPHAPYLFMMGIGQFKKVVAEPWKGKEISYYVEPEYEVHANTIFGNTREMIDFYSKKLGVDYAWPKYAQIVVRDYVSGAMENTSATLHGDFAVYSTTREILDGNKGEDIIAHELFHQWFGDLVTCESWSNLPLNESFATYGEYLWQEYKFGRDAADQHHLGSRSGYMASEKQVNLIRFDYKHREDMFDGFSYNKGGQILHMLRKAVGDDAFFASLKKYLENKKFQAAEIHDLRLAFEEVTGRDMNWFFNQWFFEKGHPELEIQQNYNATDKVVELTVEQKQDFKIAPLYELPLFVDVYVNGKAERHFITIKDVKQTFKFKTESKPELVNFDAERQLLAVIDYKKTLDEYIFQYKNAPLYQDRTEALEEINKSITEDKAYAIIKWAAENDKYYRIRQYAIGKLNALAKEKEADLKTLMLAIYKNDSKTTVRARALEFINKNYPNHSGLDDINDKALAEPSLAIGGEALDYFVKKDPKLALEKAKIFKDEPSKDILYPLAALYANHGSESDLSFYNKNLKYFGGFELISYLSNYIKFAKKLNSSIPAITAAQDFEGIAQEGGKFTKMGAMKGLKDMVSIWSKKESEMKSKIETAKKESKDVVSMEKDLKTITETKEIINKLLQGIKA